MKPHKTLEAWKQSFELVKDVYRVTSSFPSEEKFGLISQLRRAAVSIPTNIAEGAARRSKKEFIQFLYISKGSCGEFRSQLYRALDRNYLTQIEFDQLYNLAKDIIVLLQKLIDYLHKSEMNGTKFK